MSGMYNKIFQILPVHKFDKLILGMQLIALWTGTVAVPVMERRVLHLFTQNSITPALTGRQIKPL